MTTLYVLVGLPASGKSWYAKNVLSKNAQITSSDALRKELLGNENNQSNNELIFSTLYARAEQYLLQGQNVVIDATNISVADRKRLLDNFTHIKTNKIAIYFDTPKELCYIRDQQRERKVGKDVIDFINSNFEMPTINEGFNKVKIIKP